MKSYIAFIYFGFNLFNGVKYYCHSLTWPDDDRCNQLKSIAQFHNVFKNIYNIVSKYSKSEYIFCILVKRSFFSLRIILHKKERILITLVYCSNKRLTTSYCLFPLPHRLQILVESIQQNSGRFPQQSKQSPETHIVLTDIMWWYLYSSKILFKNQTVLLGNFFAEDLRIKINLFEK